MDISDWLDRGAVLWRAGAGSKREALNLVADAAGRQFGLGSATVLEALLAREAEGSTGIGSGVAIPHAILPELKRMRGVFVRLETPVPFGAIDDLPVDLIFALFAPPDAGSDHLRSLARVSRLFRQRAVRDQLRSARSADAVHALLAQEAAPTAA